MTVTEFEINPTTELSVQILEEYLYTLVAADQWHMHKIDKRHSAVNKLSG